MDCRAVGLVITGLGGNRAREDDAIDYAVGLSDVAPVGAEVGPDRPLAVVHARDASAAQEAERALLAAVHVGGEARRRAGPRVAGTGRVTPKAELHVHLEGTAPPSLVRRLAERKGLQLPAGLLARTRTPSAGRTSSTSSPPTTWRRA